MNKFGNGAFVKAYLAEAFNNEWDANFDIVWVLVLSIFPLSWRCLTNEKNS